MNMKKLLLTITLLVSGIIIAAGQSISSANVVGYVTKTLQPGFNLVCNPFQMEPGSNTLAALFPEGMVPQYTVIYKLTPSGYAINTYYDGYGWDPNPNETIDQGAGVFILHNSPRTWNITWCGQVAQGYLVNDVPGGFSMQSSQVPETINVTEMGLVPQQHDVIYAFHNDGNSSGYSIYTFYAGYGWDPGVPTGPTISLGDAFMYLNNSGASTITRNFNIQ